MAKVRLHSNRGALEANWSGSPTPYRVDNNGNVEVDEEAVGPLLERGGFTLVDVPSPVAVQAGFCVVENLNDPNAAFSYEGVSYEPDANGLLTIPLDAASVFESHGFTLVSQAKLPRPKSSVASSSAASASPKDDKKSA
jgi:hypothetical protein